MGDQPAGAMGYDGDDQPELRGYVYVFYNIYMICTIYVVGEIYIYILGYMDNYSEDRDGDDTA